jgi:hypothetical protein
MRKYNVGIVNYKNIKNRNTAKDTSRLVENNKTGINICYANERWMINKTHIYKCIKINKINKYIKINKVNHPIKYRAKHENTHI